MDEVYGILDYFISIHAPAWGATLLFKGQCAQENFNPRPRVGGDYRLPT